MNNILKKKYRIGEIIQQERKNMKLTQSDLAKKFDSKRNMSEKFMSRQTIAKWEKGESYPSVEDLCDLSEIFECDIKYLFGEFKEKTETVHDICKITKLSEKAVINIIKYSDFKQFGNIIEIINTLLENDSYLRLLQNIMLYKDELPEILDTSEANYKLFDLQRNFVTVIDEITDVSEERERKKACKQKRLF